MLNIKQKSDGEILISSRRQQLVAAASTAGGMDTVVVDVGETSIGRKSN